MTRTEHRHPDPGPVSLLITGGAAEVKIVADPDLTYAHVEIDNGEDVKVESRSDLISIKIPRNNGTTVIQHGGGKFGIVSTGDGDVIIKKGRKA